jgi:hypothetical protein
VLSFAILDQSTCIFSIQTLLLCWAADKTVDKTIYSFHRYISNMKLSSFVIVVVIACATLAHATSDAQQEMVSLRAVERVVL